MREIAKPPLTYAYYALLYLGIVSFLFIILRTDRIEPLWEFFPDSSDYKIQSEYSIFSLDFFSPKPKINLAPRPFTIPLFYKIASSNPYKMIMLQKIAYCFSVIVLIFSILNYLSHQLLKVLSAYLLLYYFTWWNIVGWSDNILSESLSMSILLLWFSIILVYYKHQSSLILFLLICISILLSFTRDTWPYIILVFAILNTLFFVLLKHNLIKGNLVFLVFSIFLFLIQNYTSSIGERYKLPVFNSIVGRVSQNDEYIKWFEDEGMPLSKNIIKDFRGIDIDDDNNRVKVYSKYKDSLYSQLSLWILKDGKAAYQKFLITHWSYFFLFDQTETQRNRIFCSKLLNYTKEPKGFYLQTDKTFPFFSLLSTALFLIIIFLLLIKTRDKILFFPILLFLLFGINALISYNADALEVERHLFITQIVLELINIISLILIINYCAVYFKAFYKNKLIHRFQ